MHSGESSDYLREKYRERGERLPKLLEVLHDVYTPSIKGDEVYTLLVDLSKSFEYYCAINKPKSDWDEYDYMMYPIWLRLKELLEK